jgi:hypothetical protein
VFNLGQDNRVNSQKGSTAPIVDNADLESSGELATTA